MIDRCPNCGRYLNPDGEAFHTREHPDCDMSYMIACCDKACADQYETKYLTANNTVGIVESPNQQHPETTQ